MTAKQQILTFTGSLISDVSVKRNGGIIYSSAQAAGSTISFDLMDDFQITEFKALKEGSFIFIAQVNSPTFNLTFSHAQFQCSRLGGFLAESDLMYVLQNLALAAPVTIGGLFYFERQATGVIYSSFN